MSLLVRSTNEHKGKVISRFEDENGNEILDLHMCEWLVIVFTDGSRIELSTDVRGCDLYISEYG